MIEIRAGSRVCTINVSSGREGDRRGLPVHRERC